MTTFIETLNHWGDHFLNFAWPMLWQSSLLIAVIFVLEFGLRRKIRAAIRYALWLVVLVKLLLPPSLALPTSPAWWIHPSIPPPAKAPPVSFTVTHGEQMAPSFPLPPPPVIPLPRAPAMSFAAWILAASGLVSAGLLAWLLVRWRQINQKARRATASEKLIPVLDETRHLTRLRPGIRLKLTEDSMSPAVCGLFRPIILLPQSLVERLSAGQLRAVLLHEAIHLRRGDVWVNCAQALLQIIYWWHPLLWLANARIRRVREEAVDDAVMLALRDDAEIYAPTLLEVAKLAFNRPLASLGLVGILESRSALRQRIERLINFNAPKKAGLTAVSILGILAFSAVALPMGDAPEKTNAAAINLESNTNSPIPTNAVNAKIESATLTQDGKMFYEMGKFDDAEAKLKAALALNPDNQAAHYYLDLVEKSRWAPKPQGPIIVYPALDGSRTNSGDVHTSPGREAIFHKLNSLRLESISWSNGLPLSEVIRYLAEQSRLQDPDKKGINFMFNPNVATGAAAGASNLINPTTGLPVTPAADAAPETVDASAISVKLTLNNTSLHDVLDAVVLVASRPIKYSVEDFAVVFSVKPPGPEPPILEMRVFKIDTNKFTAGYLRQQIQGKPEVFVNLLGSQTNSIPAIAKSFFSSIGVNLNAPGRTVAFNDKLGLLFIRATPSELAAIERVIQILNEVPPQDHTKVPSIGVPEAGSVMPQLSSNPTTGQMTGILSDTNFQARVHALEQRTGVENLAEPKAVVTSGRQVNTVSANHIQQVEYTPLTTDDNPTIATNAVESAILAQDGKLLFETGRYEDAEAKLKTAVTLNPSNLTAQYFMNLVRLARASLHTNNIHTTPAREAIFRKLNSIRLESVPWSNGIPLSEAIRFLAEQSRLRDLDKTGINFMFNPNVEASNNAPTLDASTIRIKLLMVDISLYDVVVAIASIADHPIKYSVEDYGVVFSAKPEPPEPPILKLLVFKIDTNTFLAGMRKIIGNQDDFYESGSGPESHSFSSRAKQFFALMGVNFSMPGRAIAFNDRLGLLSIKATPSEIDTVERVIQALNQRTGVESLAEPEPVTPAEQGADRINRMLVPDRIDIPTTTTNVTESGTLVQEGKLLYEMGKFEEANVKLNQALKLDPANPGAFYYLSLIQQANFARKEHNRTTQEVARAWSPKVGLGLPVPNPYAVNTNVHTSASIDPNVSQLEMRTFKVDPNTFAAGLRGVRNLQTNDIVTMAVNLFSSLGVNLSASGRSIAINDKLGVLFVKATPSELDTIERVVQVMNQIPPQIHIKARFIEVEQDNNPARGFDWYLGSFSNGPVVANGHGAPSLPAPVSAANPLGNTTTSVIPASAADQRLASGLRNTVPAPGTVTGILTDPYFRVTLHALESRPRTTILAEPEVVTTSGRQTQMRATDTKTILTNINPLALKPPGVSSNELFLTKQVECGPVFDVVPSVLADGYTINLTTTASVTEFLGYDKATNSVTVYIDGHKQTVPVPLPKFRTQKISTVVNLWDNQTLVLGGPVTSAVQTTKNKVPLLGDLPLVGGLFRSQTENSVKKQLLVFVTATIVDPAGNRAHSDDEMRQTQEKTKSYAPPQPNISTPSR